MILFFSLIRCERSGPATVMKQLKSVRRLSGLRNKTDRSFAELLQERPDKLSCHSYDLPLPCVSPQLDDRHRFLKSLVVSYPSLARKESPSIQ